MNAQGLRSYVGTALLLSACLVVAGATAGCGSRSSGKGGEHSSDSGSQQSSRHFDFWVPAGWTVDKKEHQDDWGKGEAFRLVPPNEDLAAVILHAQAVDLELAGRDAIYRMSAVMESVIAEKAVSGSIRLGTAQVAGADREVIRCRVAGSKTGKETELLVCSFAVGHTHFWIQAFEPEGEHRAQIRYILATVRVKP